VNNPPASQSDKIKQLLHTGKTVTPGEALLVFGCFRLAARIKELRSDGLVIETVLKADANGKRYASYRLATVDPLHTCVTSPSRVCNCTPKNEGCRVENTFPPVSPPLDVPPIEVYDDQPGC